MNASSFFSSLGFSDFEQVEGRSSVADMFQPDRRCGLYVFHYQNGEYYVGQAVNVVRRFGQHRKTHSDIVSMAFLPLLKEQLTAKERSTIEGADLAGFLLRNIVGTSEPNIESDFDDVVSPAEQGSWL